MAAEKKGITVIKKITIAGGGGHGGTWKVALADFMTALMAFFLVMWLLSQSAETKKSVADYFSTPALLEYEFQQYGVQITLEKLFLDLMNEPMIAIQTMMEPADMTPNIMDTGSQKMVEMFVMDRLGDSAKNMSISQDGIEFDIPDNLLFRHGSAEPIPNFINVMDKLTIVTLGLEDSVVSITSNTFVQAVREQTEEVATNVAQERADMIANKIKAGLEHNTVDVISLTNVKEKKGEVDPSKLIGLVHVSIKQKGLTSDGKLQKKLDTLWGGSSKKNEFDSFADKVTQKKKTKVKVKRDDFGNETINLDQPVSE